jgi:lysozyme
MRLSERGAADIRIKGFAGTAYLGADGAVTLGVGFTWDSPAFRKWWAKSRPKQKFEVGAIMTRSEADDCLIFLTDAEYGPAVDKFLGKPIEQHVFDAMISVLFDCGLVALTWPWATALKNEDVELAAELLRTTAIDKDGKRVEGLQRRREDQRLLLCSAHGTYASEELPDVPENDALLDNVLSIDERGPAVEELQEDLIRHGFDPGRPDSIFGFGTEAALIAFQKAKGLKADGRAGPNVRNILKGET